MLPADFLKFMPETRLPWGAFLSCSWHIQDHCADCHWLLSVGAQQNGADQWLLNFPYVFLLPVFLFGMEMKEQSSSVIHKKDQREEINNQQKVNPVTNSCSEKSVVIL